jgi:hypothetical protein
VERLKLLIEFLKLVGLLAGAVWVYFVYRKTRRGQPSASITPLVRLHRDVWPNAKWDSVLSVRIRIANTSSVMFRLTNGIAWLIDASTHLDDPPEPGMRTTGDLRLVPIAHRDPLRPLTGINSPQAEVSVDAAWENEVWAGMLFKGAQPGRRYFLEPSEALETEVAFPVAPEETKLFGIYIEVEGEHWGWPSKAVRQSMREQAEPRAANRQPATKGRVHLPNAIRSVKQKLRAWFTIPVKWRTFLFIDPLFLKVRPKRELRERRGSPTIGEGGVAT